MNGKKLPELAPVPPAKSYRFDKRTKEMLTLMNAYMQERPSVAHVSATQLVNDKKFSKEWKKKHSKETISVTPPPANDPTPAVPDGTNQSGASMIAKVDKGFSSNALPKERITSPSSTAVADVSPSVISESASNPGVEVTLNHFALKGARLKVPPPPPSDVSGAPSWTSVQLRSVHQENSDSRTNKKAPDFASLQLRKVQRAAEDPPDGPVVDGSLPMEHSDDNRSEKKKVQESSDPQVIEVIDVVDAPLVPPQIERNRKPIQQQPKKTSDPAPKQKVDEAFYYNLAADPDDEEGSQNKIVFGQNQIMMVKTKEADQQADVVWKLPRTAATSLAIDMTQLMVKLISKNGSVLRELRFETSGECLKFFNNFYDKLLNSGADEHVPTKSRNKVPQSIIDNADDDGDTEFAAVRLERLDDEEQAHLDEFRKARRLKALAQSVSKDPKVKNPISLSEEDDKIAAKYRKMLKLRIPPEAVQHGMEKDGVASHIVEAVLGKHAEVPLNVQTLSLPTSPISTFSSSTGLSEGDGQIVEKYRKMLKMGIPADAVRHKLAKDGVESKLYDLILEDNCGGSAAKPPKDSLNAADEAVAAHYRKLISRGVPKESVRFGMIKDKVAPHVMSAVLGEASDHTTVGKETIRKKGSTDVLTAEEKRIASEFKKLVKRQIPRQQILDRMKREGVNDKVIAEVLGKRAVSGTTNEDGPKGNNSRFVQIHWTPLSESQLDNSVWNTAKNRSFEVASPEGSAFSKLKELFEKKTSKNVQQDRKAPRAGDGSKKAKLLDINRSNNIAISLKAFKDYSYNELSEIIKFLDPLRKLQGERVHFLRDLLPTVSETRLVQSFDGPDSMLDPAERWFKSIVGIKRIDAKVQVLRTMEMLEIEARSIGENLRLLTKVCSQVINSDRLQDLLVVVLQIGNIMNEGTRTGGAAGFKFDSLLKLTQTKSADGKTTVLDYLVEDLFIAKGERHKLDLNSDFPECSTASRMLIGDLVAEVKSMQDSVAQCKCELDALRKESLGKNTGVSSAIAKIESQEKNSIHGAIQRLESFIETAEETVASLSQEKDDALKSSRDLCMYCGEGNGTASATSLLGILSEFANNIESAVRKCDQKKIARERKQKRQTGDAQQNNPAGGSVPTEDNGESLVLLVNKMLKDANPRTIEDFRKGRVLDNPSKLMKTIYQKEQATDPRPASRERSSLASAIQGKSEDMNDGDFLRARRKFGSPSSGSFDGRSSSTGHTIEEADPTHYQSSVRSPPLPWSPPERDFRVVGHTESPPDTSESGVSASDVTDTSTAINASVGQSVENQEDTLRRPSERPTPEGVPLRDKRNSSNINSADNTGYAYARRNLAPPFPEKNTRLDHTDKPPSVKSLDEGDTPTQSIIAGQKEAESATPNQSPDNGLPPLHEKLVEANHEPEKEDSEMQDTSQTNNRVAELAAVFSNEKSEPVAPVNIHVPQTSTVPALSMPEASISGEPVTKERDPGGNEDDDKANLPDSPKDDGDIQCKTENTDSSNLQVEPVPSEAGSIRSIAQYVTDAAIARIASWKSMERNSTKRTPSSGTPTKTLKERAALKRERRSMGRSPQKAPPPQEQDSLTGSKELPNIRDEAETVPPSGGHEGIDRTTDAPATERESSFARMAREKRAARKSLH
jgi:cellobiose-specific phosphotransferase system component IIB